MKKYVAFAILVLLYVACSKSSSNSSSSNPVQGTWAFRSQVYGTFAGANTPTDYTNVAWNHVLAGYPYAVSNTNSSALNVTFDNAGSFTATPPLLSFFSTGTPPVTTPQTYIGTYQYASSAALAITPDTSSFLAYTYGYAINKPFPNNGNMQFAAIGSDSLLLIQSYSRDTFYASVDTVGKLLYLTVTGLKKVN
jgi:hypothetical protein